MSFSKAKIQRFNDIKPVTPSPATYDVAAKNKIKKSISSQSDHIVDNPASPSISESGSTHSVPCRFRTPTLPKRKKTTTSVPKSKQLFGEHHDLEILKEKIVECDNKDVFINNLTEEIEELKDNLSNLDKQKKELEFQKQEMETKTSDLKTYYEHEIKKLTKKFEEDITKVTEEKIKVNNEIAVTKKRYEDLREANKNEMCELKNNCDKFCTLYNRSVEEFNKLMKEKDMLLKNKESELKSLENNIVEIQRNHSVEVDKLKKEHQTEIQDIEFEILRAMTELQRERDQASNKIKEIELIMEKAIADLKSDFVEERKHLMLDYENKVQQVKEQIEKAQEYEIKQRLDEVEKAWKKKLDIQQQQSDAILQECQTISEYNIIQCELEKKEIETKLAEKNKLFESQMLQYKEILSSYEDLKNKYGELQCNFSKSVSELKNSNNTFNETLHAKSSEVKNCLEENRAYLITIKSFQNTVEVLKKRLINSDKDVEQLKLEISENEGKVLEFENKCIRLTSDLKQAQEYNEELEMQHETAIKLNTREIQQMKSELIDKVESYRKEAETYSKELVKKGEQEREIMQQLCEAFEIIEKLKMEMETINCQNELELEHSRNELEDYRIREMDWNNLREKLEHNIYELENMLQIKQEELVDRKKQIAHLKEKSDSYYHYSEYYMQKVKEFERDLEDREQIHKKYIEQSGKYDELLQKFEQLEKENIEKKNEIIKLTRNFWEKQDCAEKYNRQKETYEVLLKNYELLKEENSQYKKKADEQASLKSKLDNAEEEKDVLSGRVTYLEKELKDLSDKYANLVGHQNNKQKIKHLVDLKTKNEELVQVNEDFIQANLDLESKLRSQQKTMEKIKKENSDLKKCKRKTKLHPEDKENVSSPNRSLNSSRVESPFRERN